MSRQPAPPKATEIFGAEPSLIETVRRDFRRVDEGHYRLTLEELGIEISVDRLRRKWDELVGELTVRCDLAGARTVDGVLAVADFNLSSLRARTERSRYLADRARAKDLDWAGLLEEFCQRVFTAERAGEPSIPLHEVPRPTPDAALEAFGFRLLRHHPQILFSPGGTGKSLLTLAMLGEVGRRGLRTLVLDWEMDGGEQRLRADALGLPITIHYRRCDQPIGVLAESIRRDVIAHGIDFLLLDSVAPACAGRVEEAEVAIEFFKAWRRIGRGGLAIAHTRAEDGEQRPFGSVFWHNLSRATWFLRRVGEQTAPVSPSGQSTITLGVFQRKANFGPLRAPFGLELALENADDDTLARVTVRRTDITAVPELATGLPTWQRIKHVLAHGGKTIPEIAEALDVKADTVKKALTRDKGRAFLLISRAEDEVQRWGLIERRPA